MMVTQFSRIGGAFRIDASAAALPLALVIVALIFAALEPAFISVDNLTGIVHRMATTGIMAEGMTFVIMTGGIDLSVGPVLAIAGLVAFFSLQWGAPTVIAVLAGVATGTLIGAVNGIVVAFLRLPPIIVTLGMLSIVRGSALIIGGPILHQLGSGLAYSFIGTGSILGVAFSIWVFAGVVAVMALLQNRTTFGLQVAAVGDNERAAFLSGRPVRLITMATYMISGTMAALAGIIQSSQVYTASANFGEFGTELDVIAAVVLGGTSLLGGKGSVIRTVIGVLFLGVINSGLNILNVPVDTQLITKGLIIVIALALSGRAENARKIAR
jgi:ribose/xylose/arabinose/galactoside ABC-type transport system permease subunit